MRKTALFFILVFALSSCSKKHHFNCYDGAGNECFQFYVPESDMTPKGNGIWTNSAAAGSGCATCREMD